MDSALQDVNDMYLLLEETEKQAVRRALIEERGRFCTFITFLQPVVVGLLITWSLPLGGWGRGRTQDRPLNPLCTWPENRVSQLVTLLLNLNRRLPWLYRFNLCQH